LLHDDVRGETEHHDQPDIRPHAPVGAGPADRDEPLPGTEILGDFEHQFQQILNDDGPHQNVPANPDAAPAAAAGFGIAGPAQPPPARARDPNRPVSTKKAKSLARRDRIRAYNEFLREQGDTQRAQEASTAEQRGKEQAEERARRRKVEAEIEERERKMRESRKEREMLARKEEAQKIIETARLVSESLDSSGMIELAEVVKLVDRDVAWVEAVVKKEGILGLKSENGTKVLTLLTGRGWIVRVDETSMKALYQAASAHNGSASGKIGWSELGIMLERILEDHGRGSLSGGEWR
jgi:hypothetical protein